jgi:hypothetical protein
MGQELLQRAVEALGPRPGDSNFIGVVHELCVSSLDIPDGEGRFRDPGSRGPGSHGRLVRCDSIRRATLSFLELILSVTILLAAMITGAKADWTSYYVDNATGNNRNNGSFNSPWATSAAINARIFGPGDHIYFKNTGTPYDPLYFTSSGDPNTGLILISSYGGGRAVIRASSSSHGFYCDDCEAIFIQNINVEGPVDTLSSGDGIVFANTSGKTKTYIYLDKVDVTRFTSGIFLWSYGIGSVFSYWGIYNTHAYNNYRSGIATWSDRKSGLVDGYVGYSDVYSNVGDHVNAGNGIVLGGVTRAIIEYCNAYANSGNGPVGIWTYNSEAVTIQFNQAYDNVTNSRTDGDGFDLDVGVTNSVMQYNYSHHNDGAGFLLAQNPGSDPSENTGNTVRYNISQDDGQNKGNGYGGIHLWGTITDANIYNNTVFTGAGGLSIRLQDFDGSKANIWNNIFDSLYGGEFVVNDNGASGTIFRGNDYYANGSGWWAIHWGNIVYTSLAGWRSATNQERDGAGNATGTMANPILVNPGAAGTVDVTSMPSELSSYYMLGAGSPMISSGRDPSEFSVSGDMQDFFGNLIPNGLYDVGAHAPRHMPACQISILLGSDGGRC